MEASRWLDLEEGTVEQVMWRWESGCGYYKASNINKETEAQSLR